MNPLKDPVFEPETTSDKIADFIGTALAVFYVLIALLVIIAVCAVIGVEVSSWVWGDYRVIYWIADNF